MSFISLITCHKKKREKQEIQSSLNKVPSDQNLRYPKEHSTLQRHYNAVVGSREH